MPSLDAIRIVLQAVAHYDLDMHIIDVTGTYTHAPIDRPLYVEFPEGFGKGGPTVMLLKKALYSAHQSGYLWEQFQNEKLSSISYSANPADISIFTRHSNSIMTIIVAYVDDFLICCSKGHIESTKDKIKKLFNCKDLGEAKLFVGMKITCNRSNKIIKLTNKKYIRDIISLMGITGTPHASLLMSHMHPVLVPADPNKIHHHYPYAANIGHLLWIAQTIRPDIMFVVCLLAQFTNVYDDSHIHVMKRVFQYLAGTMHIGLTFNGNQPFELVAYSDSDYGMQHGRKSISGVAVLLGGTIVTWALSKQSSVAISTMEAECYALLKAVQEVIWIRNFMFHLGFLISSPTTILVDNAAAIAYSLNPIQRTRAKHIDIQFQFMRDMISKKYVEIGPIPSRDNLADAFTKPLPYNQFWRLTNDYLGTQQADYHINLGMHSPIWLYHDDVKKSFRVIKENATSAD
ncbi:hypothetical protein OPQ81_003803 [Rhizoctonia solani]|nr:hypothetical protein OPQ81_003803 [Rhizoctonia solani]